MLNIKDFISKAYSLTLNRQFVFFAGIGFTIILLVFSINWVKTPSFSPLFSSLSSGDEKNVVKLLDANSIPYKLSPSSGLVLVSDSKVNNARMIMAQHGLPSTSKDSYDLLTKNEGIYTSQMNEDLIKKRILEENIETAIQTINGVQAAKVQLALPEHTDFMQKIIHPKASVALRLEPGVALTDEQIQGIAYLVSSSIPYMNPKEVTIIDQTGALLSGEDTSPFSLSSDQLKYKQAVENKLSRQILNVLSPILGRDNVRIQVNASLDFNVKENTTEAYMPDKRSVQSEQIERSDEKNPTGNNAQGVPGSLSNQPPKSGKLNEQKSAGAGGSAGSAAEESSRDRETYNYSLGKTITHTNYSKGSIKNLTVAIVVNDRKVPGKKGDEYIALKPEEITKLTVLAKDAIGFDESRGDKISVVNQRFVNAEISSIKKVGIPLYQQNWFLEITKGILFLIGFAVFAIFIWRPFYSQLFTMSDNSKSNLKLEEERNVETPSAEPKKSAEISTDYHGKDFDAAVSEAKAMIQKSPDVAARIIKKWMRSTEKNSLA